MARFIYTIFINDIVFIYIITIANYIQFVQTLARIQTTVIDTVYLRLITVLNTFRRSYSFDVNDQSRRSKKETLFFNKSQL